MTKEHLIPFVPGQSGNPNGRPKGSKNLTTKLREALDNISDDKATPYDELLVKSIVNDAIKTDGQSRRLILNYLEGMPKEKKELEITLPKPIMDITNGIQQNNSNKQDSITDEED